MELRVLRYFITIAEEGSISKAAEKLMITQPTLSRQLKDLEQELGELLFIREHIKSLNKENQGISSGFFGSLSTVVGDEKLTSRENLIGFLFLYVQSDENTLPKVNKVSKTEAQTFDVFDKLIGPLQFCI